MTMDAVAIDPEQLRATASAVAERAGVEPWRVAWQSAGRTPEPWLGPDVLAVLDELAEAGVPGVLVCPAGFVSDHLEVLYDLDIEARTRADELGIAFARTPSLNDDPKLCAQQMAEGVRRVLGADVGIAVTGVAGPTEQDGQPVGTVYFGLAVPGAPPEAMLARLPGDRFRIRQFATISLLNLVRLRLDALP